MDAVETASDVTLSTVVAATSISGIIVDGGTDFGTGVGVALAAGVGFDLLAAFGLLEGPDTVVNF